MLVEWIERGLLKPGKTRSGLARALGRKPPQITKMLHADPTRRRGIRADELPLIASYLDEPLPANTGLRNGHEFVTRQVRVICDAGSAAWYEASPFDAPSDGVDRNPAVPFVPHPKYGALSQFAVKVTGRDVDRVVAFGDYVVCVPYWEARRTPHDGDLVVLDIARNGLHRPAILRLRAGTPAGWELHSDYADKRKNAVEIRLSDNLKSDRAHPGDVITMRGLAIWRGAPV